MTLDATVKRNIVRALIGLGVFVLIAIVRRLIRDLHSCGVRAVAR